MFPIVEQWDSRERVVAHGRHGLKVSLWIEYLGIYRAVLTVRCPNVLYIYSNSHTHACTHITHITHRNRKPPEYTQEPYELAHPSLFLSSLSQARGTTQSLWFGKGGYVTSCIAVQSFQAEDSLNALHTLSSLTKFTLTSKFYI